MLPPDAFCIIRILDYEPTLEPASLRLNHGGGSSASEPTNGNSKECESLVSSNEYFVLQKHMTKPSSDADFSLAISSSSILPTGDISKSLKKDSKSSGRRIVRKTRFEFIEAEGRAFYPSTTKK